MKERVAGIGVHAVGLVCLVGSSGCGGPSRDDAATDVAPLASSSVASNDPPPNTKGTVSGEDLGADCATGEAPVRVANPLLPDPFKRFDGTRATVGSEWRCQRKALHRLAEEHVFGIKPSPPEAVTGSVTGDEIAVTVTDGGKTSSFTAGVRLPTVGQAPYPAIIAYGAGSGPIDTQVVNDEGVAIISYDPYAVGAEGNGRGRNQNGAFYDLYSGGSERGLLIAWAWGVSRILDVIAAAGGSVIQAEAVGVTGCSRFGKGAFVAGVFDERVALTMPIESGTAGVPLWRGIALNEQASNGKGPQTLGAAYDEQPWFADDFNDFTHAPDTAPLDTHTLVGLIAPRGLFIMDNPHIGELAPKAAHAAALVGAEVYRALGVYDRVTYWSDVASGTHCAQRPEWSTPLRDNIRRFLTKTETLPGVIKAAASQSSSLDAWRDWETPSLL